MAKSERERKTTALEAKNAELAKENADLKKRTATREAAADEVRNMYANYLERLALINEWKVSGMSKENIDAQMTILKELIYKYYGAQHLFCVLFEDVELYGRAYGDRRWGNWVNHSLVHPDEMKKRPRVG